MRRFATDSLYLLLPLIAFSVWPSVVGDEDLDTFEEPSERVNEVLEFLLKYEQQKFESDQVI